MANYLDTSRSFINGLSDFWISYFKEIDWIESLYEGEEVLVGQGYLDLMTLLLNNSVQDTALYNKQYFKQLILSEADIKYRQTSTAATAYYTYTPDVSITDIAHLNNKIFNPTVSLDNGVEYFLNSSTRDLEFKLDPTNAYLAITLGSLDSEFVVRSKLTNPDGSLIRIYLNDTGVLTPVITVSGYDITIAYDGPANTATSTANTLVQALNLHNVASGLVIAYVAGTGTGTMSPAGTAGLQYLSRIEHAAIDGVGNKNISTIFAGSLQVNTITNWLVTDVQKGDLLRLLGSATVGTPSDFEINLVRKDTIYLNVGKTTTVETADKQDFVILRRPEENTSLNEPLPLTGIPVQTGVDGSVVAATRQFSSPTASFSAVHVNELIQLSSPGNAGYFRILDVISPNTVVFSASVAVDETPVTWSLYSVIDPVNINTDGSITNNGDGTATFTAASAIFAALDTPGSAIRIVRAIGLTESFSVLSYIDAQTLLVEAAPTTANEIGLTWGWAKYKLPTATVAFSPPIAWIDNVAPAVIARRFVDNKAVVENVDYTFSKETGVVTPITVWRAATDNSITYDYLLAVVENVTPLQSAADGTLTPGAPNVFSSPTALFTQDHVGYALKFTGTPSASSDGVHFIKTVLSSTAVELTDDRYVPPGVVFPVTWELLRRGSFTNTAVTDAYQSVYWCPDVKVDTFNLYFTYGYLIDRFDRSSEEYREFIRGLFQLFMLGPTLERFESALNVVAGIPVIRDDNEILLGYDNESEASGSDGFLNAVTSVFSAASASFTINDLSKYIYIVDGFNSNQIFKILSVIDANSVTLDRAPTSDGPVSWELTRSERQTVTTSRTTYTFDRRVPLRSAVTDPANYGIKRFKAFEVISDLFNVTDYVENDNWWDLVQIPQELWPSADSLRRQSTPNLYENVVNPSDGGLIGDPGFFIGADSDGITPTSTVLRAGAADGVWVPDVYYPLSNTVYFESATGGFTASDVGNFVQIASPAGRFLIEAVISSTRVRVQSFLNLPAASGLTWDIYTGTLPKRNKAAFVILDKILKYHLFQVEFDSTLLDALRANIVNDLNELVFAAKPSYTYLVVTPSALFNERIKIEEDFDERVILVPGGGAGSTIAANTNPLLVIGASWLIGTWFRNLDTVATFSAPVASVANALGVPGAGYANYLNKTYVDPTGFTELGAPLQVSDLVFTPVGASVSGVDITALTPDTCLITTSSNLFIDGDILSYAVISGSGLGQDGTYRIIKVIDNKNIHVYTAAPLVSETGVTLQLSITGTAVGKLDRNSKGEVTFEDLAGRASFTLSNVGDYIRFPYLNYVENQTLPILEVITPTKVRIAIDRRVHPIAAMPDVPVTVASGVLTVDIPGDLIFSLSMCTQDREGLDYATSWQKRYYVEFSTGPDTGNRFYLTKYISPTSVLLETTPANAAGSLCHLGVIESPAAEPEIAFWELLREQITINGDSILLPPVGRQDANPAVSYTAYGVQEPVDPTVSVFDASLGDTYYSIGMCDPRQHRGKSRTGRDTDLREDPIMIVRTP